MEPAVEFPDRRALRPRPPIKLPAAYIVTRHMSMVERLLRHGLSSEVVAAARETALKAPDRALRIPTSQPHGEVVALLLEPSLTGSIFVGPEYRDLLRPGKPLLVYRADWAGRGAVRGGQSATRPLRQIFLQRSAFAMKQRIHGRDEQQRDECRCH